MASVYENLYGHKPNAREPAEFKVLRKVADQLVNLDPMGKAIVRETATIGIRNDLGDYLPYLFFAFHAPGSTRNWPSMPQHMVTALRMGRWVLGVSLAVPNYTREVVTPPPELEPNVDQALEDLAAWCWKDLRDDLTIHYIRVLKANMADFGHVSDDPEAGSRVVYLKAAFEERVSTNPAVFSGGDNLSRLIRFMSI